MKKFLSILLLLTLLLTLTGCYNGGETDVAQSAEAAIPAAAEEEDSKFNTFLLKKGSLITKEFIDHEMLMLGESDFYLYEVLLQIATLTDVETNDVYKALRMEHYLHNGHDFVTNVIVLDADEVDSLITALEYMQAAVAEKALKDYTEIVYTSRSGASFRLCYDGKIRLYIEDGGHYSDYAASKIPELIDALEKVKPLLVVTPAAEETEAPAAV